MKLFYRFLLIYTVTLLCGCDMLEYHPYSTDLSGRSYINSATAVRLEAAGLELPIKFAFITDTQGSLDEMNEALDMIYSRRDIDFIIHGGDMTDFGLPKEFVWTRNMLEKCGLPYLTVIGNHDCLGNGEDTYDYLFGPENYSMTVAHVHFVFLNTVALEYDYSKPVPDLDFIEEDRQKVEKINIVYPDSITHTVVVMHSRPYDEQFNNNVAKPFNHYISKYPGLNQYEIDEPLSSLSDEYKRCTRGFCINGHNHQTNISDIFDNGILYYQCANMGKRAFFVFTITNDGYSHEIINF